MAFKPLFEKVGGNINPDDVPWGNVYAKKNKDYEEPRLIHYIREYDNGLMVITFRYKAYFHVGQTDHTQLLEALQVWSSTQELGQALLCVLDKRGKPCVGYDEDQPETYWHHSESDYVQVPKKEFTEVLKKEVVNPLLAGRGVRNTTHGSVDVPSTFPPQDVPVEPSGRARKGK